MNESKSFNQEEQKQIWDCFFEDDKHKLRYPDENVVGFVFRNFGNIKQKNRKDVRILDHGSGTGRHLVFMAREGFSVQGFDYSKEALKVAKSLLETHGLDVDLKQGDAISLPYPDNSFDAVVSWGVLYYNTLSKIKKTMKEINRVLKPNGRRLASFRSKDNFFYGWGKEIERDAFITNEREREGLIYHFFDEGGVRELFEESDFLLINVEKLILLLQNLKYRHARLIVQAEKRT